ncbi:MAG TPA: hypothetical protein VGX23_12595 [Actinocrinis sp.]|nr:hypothetical protein [Actinocrinis sp.]
MQVPDTAQWSEQETLALAERYEQDGWPAEAFELYRRAARRAAAALPPDRAVDLLRRLRAAGIQDAAADLFRGLVEACGPAPATTARMTGTLAAALGPDTARDFLDAVLAQYQASEGDLESLAAYLNAGNHQDLSTYAFTAAARTKPIPTVLRYGEILRMRGHADGVVELLVSVLAGRPQDIGTLLGALRKARRGKEVDPLLARLAGIGDEACAAMLDALVAQNLPADARTLALGLNGRPFAQVAATVVAVRSPEVAATLVPALLARPEHEVQDGLGKAQAQLSAQQMSRLVNLLMSIAPDQCPEQLVVWYAGWVEPAGLARLIDQLDESAANTDPLLFAVARREDFEQLRDDLHRRGHHQLAYHLAGLRAEYRPS